MSGGKKHSTLIRALKERRERIRVNIQKRRLHVSGNFLLDDSLSARKVLSKTQKVKLSIFSLIVFIALLMAPIYVFNLIGATFALFYLAVVCFRAAVLIDFDLVPFKNAYQECDISKLDKRYAVLVTLYKEANQVPDLVTALARLKWPKDKLNIYLICEQHDKDTLDAIKRLSLPNYIQLVVCPEGYPQTKPRALNYVLQDCETDYLVIYDAEDRPHPDQLVEAHSKFMKTDDKVVCLQAPLVVDNTNASFFTRMFAIEYLTLFYGILVSLSNWKAPMPLGGTSNHFKKNQLVLAGGWDAYNVTEDADLGLRLARMGYECSTLTLPTYEEAPASFSAWLPQRTRWLKGWMQTFLVNMRFENKKLGKFSLRNYFLLHMVLTSIVISIIIHPFFLVGFFILLFEFATNTSNGIIQTATLTISTFTLSAGYLTYGFLAYAVTKNRTFAPSRLWILALPIYWIFISIAGWRALLQLLISPHKWEKTAHGNSVRATPKL